MRIFQSIVFRLALKNFERPRARNRRLCSSLTINPHNSSTQNNSPTPDMCQSFRFLCKSLSNSCYNLCYQQITTKKMSKIILITGASRGFGKIWAKALLQRGDKVAATARNLEDLNDLV